MRPEGRSECAETMRRGSTSGTIYVPCGFNAGSIGVEICRDEVGERDREAEGAGGGGAVVAEVGRIVGVKDTVVEVDSTCLIVTAGCWGVRGCRVGDWRVRALASRASFVLARRASSRAAMTVGDAPARVFT